MIRIVLVVIDLIFLINVAMYHVQNLFVINVIDRLAVAEVVVIIQT